MQRGIAHRMSERHPRELEPLTESINAFIEAELERLENFPRLQQLGGHAHLLHHVGAQAEETHVQTLEVCWCIDRLFEPARSLRRNDRTRQYFNVVAAVIVHLLIEFQTVAVVHPRQVFTGFRTERNRRKQRLP